MDTVSKSVFVLKPSSFLCDPNVQEMSLSHLENLGVVPTPQGTPTSVLTCLGGRELSMSASVVWCISEEAEGGGSFEASLMARPGRERSVCQAHGLL